MNYPKFWIYVIAATIAVMIVACLCSCNLTSQTRTIKKIGGGMTFDVIEIDSCEYIIGNAGYKGYMAHKGNCKYCAKRYDRNIKYQHISERQFKRE